MNRLKGLRCYLAGPIDRCPNGGTTWRREITPFLQDRNVTVFDPTNKPISWANEDPENIETWNDLRKNFKYDELSSRVKQISNMDLRMVDICDFLIVHLDIEIYPAGTVWEMVIANLQKKPILLHFEQGKDRIPHWYFGRLPHNEFFDNWGWLKNYLVTIDTVADFNPGKRWYFFDKDNI